MDPIVKAIDNSFLRELRGDPATKDNWPNQRPRRVLNAHYVLFEPKALPKPTVIALSEPFVTGELGLPAEVAKDSTFIRLFGADPHAAPGAEAWATPYALSIFGSPIIAPDPATGGNGYGDGRAGSFMEVVVPIRDSTAERSIGGLCPSLFAGAQRPEPNGQVGSTTISFVGTPQFAPAPPALLALCSDAVSHRLTMPSLSSDTSSGPASTGTSPDEKDATPPHRRWEFQWKGSGPTPFCRGADGRAVLRSSIREFLASEFMAAAGVPTTRALGILSAPDEKAFREWYSHGRSVQRHEGCAITTRVAPSFIRVGHFELWGRRARGILPLSEPAVAKEMMRELLVHAVRREYPDLAAAFGIAGRYAVSPALLGTQDAPPSTARGVEVPKGLILAFLEALTRRIGDMVCAWINVGYVQGNFNSDNTLVGGRTLDYGPFGYVDVYAREWQMWTGGGDKFSFMSQPTAAAQNILSLVEALTPIIADPDEAAAAANVPRRFGRDFQKTLQALWRRKFGLPPAGECAATDAAWDERGVSISADFLALLERSQGDWTATWRQLGDGFAALSSFTAEATDEDLAKEAKKILAKLDDVFYSTLTDKSQSTWLDILIRILRIHRAGCASGPFNGETVCQRIRAVSPRFVPREHILMDVYTSATEGNLGPLRAFQAVLLRPYEEGSDEERQQFASRTPADRFTEPGVRFMSCSS